MGDSGSTTPHQENNNTMTSAQLQADLEIAITAARRAGEYLAAHLGQAHVEYQKAPLDYLLDVDLGAERIILDIFAEYGLPYGILSEEAGRSGDESSYWIIDPLDGSANFLHGIPLFGTAIALTRNGTTELGVIYLPMQDELFTATRGNGSLLNGKPIHVSTRTPLEETLIHCGGFARGPRKETANRRRIAELGAIGSAVKQVRQTGSSALDLTYVSCGRADALVNHATHVWDIDAGQLIITEAGGICSIHPNKEDSNLKIYSSMACHDELVALIHRVSS
jgi:myo-inositol-1(or 4)-monophosphatase